MIYTLLDARNHVSKFVESGTCPSKPVVLERINEACRRLMQKANWTHTIHRIRFATYWNTITLPRGSLAILNCTIDQSPRRIFGQSYEFLENGPGELEATDGYGKDLLDMGDGWPTFFDIPHETPSKLIAFSTSTADVAAGLKLTLRGQDSNTADICTNGVPGETLDIGYWQGGVEGTVDANNLPDLSTSTFWVVTDVVKPVTQGYISLYTYDPDDHRMYFLAKYHPQETHPGYRRYRITSPDFTSGSNVLCQVKMRFEPLIQDTDILPIQNLDAIKAAVIAIREENDKNAASAKEYWNTAVGLLNDQLIDSREGLQEGIQFADPFGLGSAPVVR